MHGHVTSNNLIRFTLCVTVTHAKQHVTVTVLLGMGHGQQLVGSRTVPTNCTQKKQRKHNQPCPKQVHKFALLRRALHQQVARYVIVLLGMGHAIPMHADLEFRTQAPITQCLFKGLRAIKQIYALAWNKVVSRW